MNLEKSVCFSKYIKSSSLNLTVNKKGRSKVYFKQLLMRYKILIDKYLNWCYAMFRLFHIKITLMGMAGTLSGVPA